MAMALQNPWLWYSMSYFACECIVYFFWSLLQLHFPTCGDIELGVTAPSSSQCMSSGVASAPLPSELSWCFLYTCRDFIGTFVCAKAAVLSFLACAMTDCYLIFFPSSSCGALTQVGRVLVRVALAQNPRGEQSAASSLKGCTFSFFPAICAYCGLQTRTFCSVLGPNKNTTMPHSLSLLSMCAFRKVDVSRIPLCVTVTWGCNVLLQTQCTVASFVSLVNGGSTQR